jgi:hypothetical protein
MWAAARSPPSPVVIGPAMNKSSVLPDYVSVALAPEDKAKAAVPLLPLAALPLPASEPVLEAAIESFWSAFVASANVDDEDALINIVD